MTKYAEINAEGFVTKVLEDDGSLYGAPDGNFLIGAGNLKEGSRYEPVEGNFPVALTALNRTPVEASSLPVGESSSTDTDDSTPVPTKKSGRNSGN